MGIPVLKYIPGYENLYSIDTNGNVYSHISNKYLKPNVLNTGYVTVQLFKNKKGKRLLIHRLVAKTFIPNPNNLPQINHKDENKQNNNVKNLEWCTAKYNMNFGIASKTRHSNIDYSTQKRKEIAIINGRKCSKPILQIKNNKIIGKFKSGAEASRKTNTNHSHLLECCNGKRHTANGYEWKFDKIERSDDISEFQY